MAHPDPLFRLLPDPSLNDNNNMCKYIPVSLKTFFRQYQHHYVVSSTSIGAADVVSSLDPDLTMNSNCGDE